MGRLAFESNQMAYLLIISPEAERQLRRLDRQIARRLVDKLGLLAANAEDARHLALSGSFAGLYRYRVGDYRAIYELDHQTGRLVVKEVGHRRDVYKS